jgi:hypothetical protein
MLASSLPPRGKSKRLSTFEEHAVEFNSEASGLANKQTNSMHILRLTKEQFPQSNLAIQKASKHTHFNDKFIHGWFHRT